MSVKTAIRNGQEVRCATWGSYVAYGRDTMAAIDMLLSYIKVKQWAASI